MPFGYSPALSKTLPEGAQLFPYQMTKIFYICKRIFFAISNFATTDEIPSESGYLSLPSIDSSKAKQAAPGSDLSV